MDPNETTVPDEAKGSRKRTLASVVALVASLGGNVLQWQKNSVELERSRAEVEGLQQQQRENATKSVQSWIEQLQKFDTVEDRVMVLSAAMSTTPYDSVKSWAQEQMLRLEGDLDKRKTEAAQQLALANTPAAPSTTGAPGHSAATGGGAGLGAPGTTGHGAGAPRTTASPEAPASPVALALAQRSAQKTLDRVSTAETMLKAAKAAVGPKAVAPKGMDP